MRLVWSSITSPMSIKGNTNVAPPATSMVRNAFPYPIQCPYKLWVSAIYGYVLCTCCCGVITAKAATPQNMTTAATVTEAKKQTTVLNTDRLAVAV